MNKKSFLFVLVLLVIVSAFGFWACSPAKPAEEPPAAAVESEPAAESAAMTADSKYPEREVTIVVPFNAGGASDMTTRIASNVLKDALNQTILVVNKPGGSGGVGMAEVRAAKPDGYTLCYIPVEIVMHKKLGISDIVPEDFDFVSQLTLVPSALTVPADAPYDTVEEFIAYAKDNPSEIKVGNSGNGSIWHIAATLLEKESGVKFNHIMFDGGAPAVTALMGGHIDAVTVNLGEVKSGVDAGKLKVLGIMTEERDADNPDIPTLKESGFNVIIGGWGAFAAPKGTDPAILSQLSEAVKTATEAEKFKSFITERGMIVQYRDASEVAEFVKEQEKFFSDLLDEIDLEG